MANAPSQPVDPASAGGLTAPGKPARLVELSRNAKGELIARLEDMDAPVTDVRVARCFPWSLPEAMISIRDKDGKELVLLETLEGLPEPTRRIIEEELRDKVFAPRITKILSYEDRFGITTIKAQTDRGEVTFQLRHSDDVRTLSPIRAVFKDVDGNMYELPDIRALDDESRKHLREFF